MVDLEDTLTCYKDRKVLVTGHTGFKGSWLTIWLSMLGAEITGYSLDPPSVPNMFEVCALEEQFNHIHGDVRDYDHLLQVFKSYKPEFVFHLAAQPLVRLSYEEPRLTYETNVMGTVNVLEAVRATDSVCVVVNVTSDKCYENREWVWGYRENDPMGGYDPYSSSKGCAELVNSAFLKSFFPPDYYGNTHHVGLASVRSGNSIGGGDWGTDRLIPDCVRALSGDEGIVVRNPAAMRPWQHVLEPLYGYLLLGSKLYENASKYSGAWNFGPLDSEIWTVERVVKAICEMWRNGRYSISDEPHVHEATWLKLDCSKAKSYLNWAPKFDIEEALHKTVEWYKLYYSDPGSESIKQFSSQQIREYSQTTIQ
jgi:CDP-glucose 4,6-dehydratase